MVGFHIERELQIDRAKADTALAGQRLTQSIIDFGQPLRRRRNEERRLFLLDAIEHVHCERMWIAVRLGELLLLDDLARQLEVAVMRGVLGIGKGRPQRSAVLDGLFSNPRLSPRPCGLQYRRSVRGDSEGRIAPSRVASEGRRH